MGTICDQSGNITAEFRDSTISGWYIGVGYGNSTEDSCRVSVSTDCKDFSNNDFNVLHSECSPPTCDPPLEECQYSASTDQPHLDWRSFALTNGSLNDSRSDGRRRVGRQARLASASHGR